MKRNYDIGTIVLTGIMSGILTFSILMLSAFITDTDITLWDRTKAIPIFVIITGLIWWYLLSSGNKKEYKRLKKA